VKPLIDESAEKLFSFAPAILYVIAAFIPSERWLTETGTLRAWISTSLKRAAWPCNKDETGRTLLFLANRKPKKKKPKPKSK